MRQHIGKHIIFKDIIENVRLCGFCGGLACSIDLTVSSGKGKNKIFKASSDCKFAFAFSLKAASKISKNTPCTNRPIECSICKRVYWSYNIMCHYKISHPNLDPPILVTDEEKNKVLEFMV